MADTKLCVKCNKEYEADSSPDILFEYPGVNEPRLRYNLCFECVNEVACLIEGFGDNSR